MWDLAPALQGPHVPLSPRSDPTPCRPQRHSLYLFTLAGFPARCEAELVLRDASSLRRLCHWADSERGRRLGSALPAGPATPGAEDPASRLAQPLNLARRRRSWGRHEYRVSLL